MRSRAFWLALALSLAVHAVMIAGLPGNGVARDPAARPLTAELQRVAPPTPADAATVPAPARPARQPVAKPSSPAAAVESLPAPATPAPVPAPEAVAATDPSPDTLADAEPAATPAPPPQAVEAPPETLARADSEVPALVEVMPTSGTITYDLVYGGGSVGRSVQTWRIDRAAYRLASTSEPTGLVALFLPYRYAYTSEGRVGPGGLVPENFTASSGRGGSRRAQAAFDWSRREVTLHTAGPPRTVAVPEGTQDMLSFVYQMALGPLEPGTRRMTITSGTKVEVYVLAVGAEEAIDLPAGPMRAIPIRRIAAPGEESMQLWLRAAPPRLPVRVRFFDRSGRMTIEQLAARIDIDGT